jgi:hypothetical protein
LDKGFSLWAIEKPHRRGPPSGAWPFDRVMEDAAARKSAARTVVILRRSYQLLRHDRFRNLKPHWNRKVATGLIPKLAVLHAMRLLRG